MSIVSTQSVGATIGRPTAEGVFFEGFGRIRIGYVSDDQ